MTPLEKYQELRLLTSDMTNVALNRNSVTRVFACFIRIDKGPTVPSDLYITEFDYPKGFPLGRVNRIKHYVDGKWIVTHTIFQ